MKLLHGMRIHITGVVQGVGFRPFVYGLASRLSLRGWVRNTSAGVDIHVDGTEEALSNLVTALVQEAPPLARIDTLEVERSPADGFTSFEIIHSEPIPGSFQPVSPDVSLCPDCAQEIQDPSDRRYRYPFTNCTNCGPRFTIITDIPYDRPNTTMAPFAMCSECAREYQDPLDRRFHAQPVACPSCGPHVWLEVDGQRAEEREEAVQAARRLLRQGRIVAVKGLGGFHLACDATSPVAVAELRQRKLRVDKPFAIMMPDVETVEANCILGQEERQLLLSPERPIVVLHRRPESNVAPDVAPNQDSLGVMLPYTPLHILLTQPEPGYPQALVMTSGNLSEEPIAIENQDARRRLSTLADGFLMHDRDIRTRCDDSVVRAFDSRIYPLRRSRGYAPFPVRLGWDGPALLATGGELKNTVCLTRERYAFLSHHIGDLENLETLLSFEDGIAHLERLFRIRPEALAYDLHPDYLASRYALERAGREALPAVGVQHHHAHIAACMAEHGLPAESQVIGVAFDGTGYGTDGAIWGGEFLLASYQGFERLSHLAYVPMPGGDTAVKQPWRLALAWLANAGVDWLEDLPPVQATTAEARETLRRMIDAGINVPPTSSMGRLFDGVAALAGVRQMVNYEAQAAMELEAQVDPQEQGAYPFAMDGSVINPAPTIQAIAADLRSGLPVPSIAARFHNAVARMVTQVCCTIRSQHAVDEVALSGGVWQNMVLMKQAVRCLSEAGFTVLVHSLVPANDGGLALGQAAVAAHVLPR